MHPDKHSEVAPPPLPPFPPAEPRNPFETFLLAWSALASAGFTTGDPGSRILQETLPERAVVLWGAALLIGSVASLIGIVIQKWSSDGYVLERSGLLLVGGAALVYGYVVQTNAEQFSDVRYIVAIQYAFAMASLWRAWHISKRLRWLRSIRHNGEE